MFKFLLDSLVVVEFAVDDDAFAIVFARDRLITRPQVDDAKSCVTKSYSTIGRDPVSLSIRTAVREAPRSHLQRRWSDRTLARE
jgi:hypothetical protein